MKIVQQVILVYTLASCSTKYSDVKFPNLEVDPLKESFKMNNVKAYYQTLHGVDYKGKKFSYKSDSANFNRDGILTSFFQLDDFLGGMTYFNRYDSLKRLISQEYRSCTYSDYFLKYEFDPRNRKAIKYKYDLVGNDSLLLIKTVYSLDLENTRVLNSVKYWKDTNDTINLTNYEYEKGKLVRINSRRGSIDYMYSETGMLTQIHKVVLDEKGDEIEYLTETDYISSKTGLIDSTLLGGNGWVNYYNYEFWE